MIRAKGTIEERFWAHVQKTDNCWLWNGSTLNKYGYFGYGGKTYRAHRIAFMLTKRSLFNPALSVLHTCDNPPCVNPDHLFQGTQTDNIIDMDIKGRRGKSGLSGEYNPSSKLTNEEVVQIRKLLSTGKLYQREIAKIYGVHTETIGAIKRGKNWRIG